MKKLSFGKNKLVVFLALSISSSALLAQTSEYVFVMAHIDNVREHKSLIQTLGECGNDNICQGGMEAISAYSGIPLNKVTAVAANIGDAAAATSEGTYKNYFLPQGYSYCSATVGAASIVPRDGPRGSMLLVRADPKSVYVDTWTPVQPFGSGRSWVEFDITIIGVRDDRSEVNYQDGTSPCHRPSNRVVLYCRGSGCEAVTVDRGQSVSAASPPPAGGRN